MHTGRVQSIPYMAILNIEEKREGERRGEEKREEKREEK